MDRRCRLLGSAIVVISVGVACAQTPLPVLGSIEAPYAPIQNSVTIAGKPWAPGLTAYGSVNTPLVLSGSNLGGSGIVQFWAYKNGVVDTSVGDNGAVAATVTLWMSNMLILTVPSGATSGLVTVTVEGQTSNGLPFLVTPGTYSASCPAGPTSTQLQITTSLLHDGAVGQPYNALLGATGGTASYTWSIASGSLPSGLTLSASGTISGTPSAATGFNPSPVTFRVVDESSPPQSDDALISLTVQPQPMISANGIYSYTVSYDGVGNVTQFKDLTYNNGPGIMGTWNMLTAAGGGEGYDSLNRLTAASATWPDGTQQYYCWAYDPFGNRTAQSVQTTTCPSQEMSLAPTEHYNSDNRINSGLVGYDGAGDVNSDATTGNTYLYDAEGRVCAVKSEPYPGIWTMIGYLYDADGNRIAKGSITSMSCDPTHNGFQFTENHVLGPDGEELTTLDGSNNWQRTNLFVGGKLIGTYDLVNDPSNSSQLIPWLHFYLEDPLGTRRMQISGMLGNLGQPETDFQSLPFGDQLATFPDPNADQIAEQSLLGATPLFFTGKERDAESGNDYFGARYYASTIGRFLSPDPINLTEERLVNPANTLNKYAYAANNPLKYVDPDGEDITYFYDQGGIAGHAMLFAYNQQTGDSAIEDFGPTKHMPVWWGNSMHETPSFTSADDIRHQTAALTIQTTPELAQQVIDYIRSHPDPATWYCFGKQCSSQVWKILQKFKLDNQNTKENQGASPADLWVNLMSRYNGTANSAFYVAPKNGKDYGRPRFDMFQLFWQSLPQAKQPQEVVTHKICDENGKNCH